MTLERLKKIIDFNEKYNLGKRVRIYCDNNEWESVGELLKSFSSNGVSSAEIETKGALSESGLCSLLLMYYGYEFQFLNL